MSTLKQPTDLEDLVSAEALLNHAQGAPIFADIVYILYHMNERGITPKAEFTKFLVDKNNHIVLAGLHGAKIRSLFSIPSNWDKHRKILWKAVAQYLQDNLENVNELEAALQQVREMACTSAEMQSKIIKIGAQNID